MWLIHIYIYIYIYISYFVIVLEVEIRLPENSFYGPLSVSNQGMWSYICGSGGWTDKEAKVACHELGYEVSVCFSVPYLT